MIITIFLMVLTSVMLYNLVSETENNYLMEMNKDPTNLEEKAKVHRKYRNYLNKLIVQTKSEC